MKRIYLLALLLLSVMSCSSTQSLQEYFVDNSENPNFLSFDVPTSLLNLEAGFSQQEKQAIASFNKLDVLAFKKTETNNAEYTFQKQNVKSILNDESFVQLMKMNTPYGKAIIKYLGEEDEIDEIVIYGDSSEKGFALIRVLGKNMNPIQVFLLMQAIEKSDYKGEGLKKLEELFKN